MCNRGKNEGGVVDEKQGDAVEEGGRAREVGVGAKR